MSNQPQLNAQTVIHLAEHLARLKEAAAQFAAATKVRERGYFGPSEDDQVVHLWVSYHMARNALFEVITDYRHGPGTAAQVNLADFAIAYAAAAVLVDAGRFLRELFSEEPIIRRKLNESYDLYGIPANSFDAIQMSLSDPLHAIQLYQANESFETNAAEIRELGRGDRLLGEIVALIDGLGERLHVSASAYAKARASERARHTYEKIVHRGIGKAIYAIQAWVSDFVGHLSTRPNHQPALPREIKSQLLERLQPGDVMVTRKEHSLTNYFLPGYWPHAALYIGEGRVIEALADGVHERSIESPFAVDAIATIRPQIGTELIDQAIARVRTHIGKPYDFDFDFTRADRMVCTEVVYRCYEGIGEVCFQLTRRAARETLSAEDLLRLARNNQHFGHVALYCPLHSDQLLVDERIEEVLQATMGC